jgi:hypothetical protein
MLINPASPNFSFEIYVGKSYSREEAEVRRSAEVNLASAIGRLGYRIGHFNKSMLGKDRMPIHLHTHSP